MSIFLKKHPVGSKVSKRYAFLWILEKGWKRTPRPWRCPFSLSIVNNFIILKVLLFIIAYPVQLLLGNEKEMFRSMNNFNKSGTGRQRYLEFDKNAKVFFRLPGLTIFCKSKVWVCAFLEEFQILKLENLHSRSRRSSS